jgi:hypothetical protein
MYCLFSLYLAPVGLMEIVQRNQKLFQAVIWKRIAPGSFPALISLCKDQY